MQAGGLKPADVLDGRVRGTQVSRMNELAGDELERALEQLDGWALVASEVPGEKPQHRTELNRAYEFASFEEAMDFMAAAARHISSVNHHPRWGNRWRTVTVWLCTWAMGNKPSPRDIELAHFLDQLYRGYKQHRS